MASISNDKGSGRRRINFFDAAGKRKSLRLGEISERDAKAIKRHVEEIINARIRREPTPRETAVWVADLDNVLRDKLAKVGLTTPAGGPPPLPDTLGPFLDHWLQSRADAKPNSLKNYRQAVRVLREHFDDATPLRDFTDADAKNFRRWLTTHDFRHRQGSKGGPLCENTANRLCGFARQFFNDAVDAKLIADNPFKALKRLTVRGNRSRDYHLSREDAFKVIDACPDTEWRLIFALTRFGGLRCPSELQVLKWGHVNWETGRFLCKSTKTGDRLIPIFAELRPHLEDAYELAGRPGPEAWVIVNHRQSNPNLRTHGAKIVESAGLKPWGKLFQNLRMTRETELAGEFPIHVVCEWIGNSQVVAKEHYLRATDADFDKAAHQAAQQPSPDSCKKVQPLASISTNPGDCDIPAVSATFQYTPQESNL